MQMEMQTSESPLKRPSLNPMVMHHALVKLLKVDKVVTDAQLVKLNLDGKRLPHVSLTVRPLPNSSVELGVTFRALSQKYLYAKTESLPHYAGLAAGRHALHAALDEWTVMGNGKSICPDAEWRSGGRVIAVEYDAGYRPGVVAQKMESFKAYDAVIWVTPSRVRTERLQAKYPAVQVITVDYWTASQT